MIFSPKEDPALKKSNRGFMGYVVMIGVFLLIALLLNGTMTGAESKRIEYPQLLEMIDNGDVARVAIRNSSLVGLKRTTTVAAVDFPDRRYDFETTIGDDFIETVSTLDGNAPESITAKHI